MAHDPIHNPNTILGVAGVVNHQIKDTGDQAAKVATFESALNYRAALQIDLARANRLIDEARRALGGKLPPPPVSRDRHLDDPEAQDALARSALRMDSPYAVSDWRPVTDPPSATAMSGPRPAGPGMACGAVSLADYHVAAASATSHLSPHGFQVDGIKADEPIPRDSINLNGALSLLLDANAVEVMRGGDHRDKPLILILKPGHGLDMDGLARMVKGDQPTSFGGVVLDAATGKPLAGALVSCRYQSRWYGAQGNGEQEITCITDNRGNFVICGLPAWWSFTVEVQLGDARISVRELTANLGFRTYRLDTGAVSTPNVEPVRWLRGQVRGHASPGPVVGATIIVNAQGQLGGPSTQTDDNGFFGVKNPPIGPVTVLVEAVGYRDLIVEEDTTKPTLGTYYVWPEPTSEVDPQPDGVDALADDDTPF